MIPINLTVTIHKKNSRIETKQYSDRQIARNGDDKRRTERRVSIQQLGDLTHRLIVSSSVSLLFNGSIVPQRTTRAKKTQPYTHKHKAL
jgi:hypothetical protein